jgi:hypothetical protein
MSFARYCSRVNQLAVTALLSACAVTPVWAQASDSKAKLIDRLLTLWHPEEVVVMMVQRPAVDAVQQARIALQGRVTAERRDAALKDMAVDVQQYINDATPIALDAARRQIAGTVVPILQQQFSEEELKQIIAMLESPVKKKFEQMIPQMERSLGEKVVAQSRADIDPKMQALTKAVGLKLRAATTTP